ncbi:MAG: hypothetical protein KDD61_15300 [Bdellovibrionales bacterium]|nr:hypothetical protein [Bdellovibrionales bacterium]
MSNKYKLTIPMAIVITLIAIVYQRTTGPTYPKKFKINYQGEKVRVKLPRSQENTEGALISLPLLDKSHQLTVFYKRFPTNDEWSESPLEMKASVWEFRLPVQPAAGKLQYYIEMKDQEGNMIQSLGNAPSPILIRYKGPVSAFILAPHIFCMFFAMLLSALAGSEALFKTEASRHVGRWALGFLFVGGMILGPLVQKSAFGVYWAGFPFDWDLTDNKLLIGFLAWLIAVIANAKAKRPKFTLAAAIVLIGMYSIPHSTMGSQYNYEEGKVVTDR